MLVPPAAEYGENEYTPPAADYGLNDSSRVEDYGGGGGGHDYEGGGGGHDYGGGVGGGGATMKKVEKNVFDSIIWLYVLSALYTNSIIIFLFIIT